MNRGIIVLFALMVSQHAHADNVRLHGTLVADPCVLRPGDENVSLEFGPVMNRDLYSQQRTRGKAFDIHLAECDLSLGNIVKISFSGIENPYLKGLLAIDVGSQASGIAIGIETLAGKALPLNKAGSEYPLVSGSNVLTMQAYVQGEPDAIASQTIEPGPFNAIATFNLEYE